MFRSPFIWLGLALGFILVFGLQVNLPWTPIAIFIAGALAISAMLLPGISGSLILVLLGLYEPIIDALTGLDFYHISFFIAGALTGLFGFSKLIMAGLKNYQQQTLSFIVGLMLGVLPKLWPWQGDDYALELLTPAGYSSHGSSSYIIAVVIAFAVGLSAILFLQRLNPTPSHTPPS